MRHTARVQAQPKPAPLSHLLPADTTPPPAGNALSIIETCIDGGIPKGSNILVTGKVGSGKSTFAREFISKGLTESERCLLLGVDDAPSQIRQSLEQDLPKPIAYYESIDLIRFVDAYSWSSLNGHSDEIGHTVQSKLGGRRVIDSISSLFVEFDLSAAQRFINQLARTAIAFGNVTTLFILEEGTVSDQVLNNIKYIMDGIIEFKLEDTTHMSRIASMKWAECNTDWRTI